MEIRWTRTATLTDDGTFLSSTISVHVSVVRSLTPSQTVTTVTGQTFLREQVSGDGCQRRVAQKEIRLRSE